MLRGLKVHRSQSQYEKFAWIYFAAATESTDGGNSVGMNEFCRFKCWCARASKVGHASALDVSALMIMKHKLAPNEILKHYNITKVVVQNFKLYDVTPLFI